MSVPDGSTAFRTRIQRRIDRTRNVIKYTNPFAVKDWAKKLLQKNKKAPVKRISIRLVRIALGFQPPSTGHNRAQVSMTK